MQVNYLRSLPFPFSNLIGLNVNKFADGKDGGDNDGNGSGGSDDSKNTAGSGDSKNTNEPKIDDKSFQLGINKATAKWKTEIEKLQSQLKEFEKMKEEIENQKTEAEIKDLEKKKEYQAIIEKNQKIFDEKEAKFKQQNSILETDLERLVIESEIAKLAPELKVIPEAMPNFIRLTASMMGYAKEEIDGQIKYKVFPSNNGNPMVNEKGQDMSVKEFLENFLEKENYFRQPLTQGGSGGRGGRSSGTTIQTPRDAIREGMKQRRKQ